MSPGWTTLAGLGILALLAVDVFVTVLHASSGAGPYTSLQNRAIWRTARAAAAVLPAGRTWRGLAAPVMALATPVGWIALLTCGFALLYHPVLDTFGARPPLEVPRWVGALYYSGYLTTTLGLGDVTPSGLPWRLAAVVHPAVGFALFSAAITYILSIYSRHSQDAALALHIHNALRESDLSDWGEPGSGSRAQTRSHALDLAVQLSALNAAHDQYPILHYFHGPPEKSVVVQAGRLIGLVRTAPPEEARGAARALERALHDFFDQMPFETSGGREESETLDARHRRLLETHGYPSE